MLQCLLLVSFRRLREMEAGSTVPVSESHEKAVYYEMDWLPSEAFSKVLWI